MSIPNGNSALDRARRDAEWKELDELVADGGQVDLLVIGAGVTGAGIALDAASRGLDVVLVDRQDIAFGTSRWSSKLAHGGLRYLASGNVGIARRSAKERGILMEVTAPHLVHALPQVVPVLDEFTLANKTLPRVGFIAGDALRIAAGTAAATLPRSRTVGPKEVVDLAPTVRTEGLRFGYVNYDGQLVDDARLVVALARTAAACGARVLTQVGAADATGTAATLVDGLGGGELRLRARNVVNATGVWAGGIDPTIRVRPSRGTHLVFDAALFGNPAGSLTVPVPGALNRFCFVLPAPLGRVYVGLTDEDAPGPIPDEPEPTEAEIDFLLEVINRGLARKVGRADILGAFAGLRPLIDSGEGDTADLSREHAIIVADNGLISVVGGKLTEYRLMAEQTVDAALARTGQPAAPCWTDRLPLVGAEGEAEPLPAAAPRWLTERYGVEAGAVVAASKLDRPLDRVAEGVDVTRAEFSWAVTHEGALTVADILDRRTRIGLVPADRAAAAPAAEEALAACAG